MVLLSFVLVISRGHTLFPLQAAAVLVPLDAHQEIPAASAKQRVDELLPGLGLFRRRRRRRRAVHAGVGGGQP